MQQQMSVSQQLAAARHLASSPAAFNVLLQSQSNLRAGAGAGAGVGVGVSRSASAASSSGVLAGVKSKRVRDALTKAHRAMGLDAAAASHAEPLPAAHSHAPAPSHLRALPAASNIDPSLAYLQQLRRREIHDK